jgi:hypothetical protein
MVAAWLVADLLLVATPLVPAFLVCVWLVSASLVAALDRFARGCT